MTHSKCSVCLETKPVFAFYERHIKLKGGGIKLSHQSRCKQCNNQESSARSAQMKSAKHKQFNNL